MHAAMLFMGDVSGTHEANGLGQHEAHANPDELRNAEASSSSRAVDTDRERSSRVCRNTLVRLSQRVARRRALHTSMILMRIYNS